MQASHERILTLLYQHKLEFQQALATQREDFIRRWRSSASISTPHWQNSAKSFMPPWRRPSSICTRR
jgi:hypothetical protein